MRIVYTKHAEDKLKRSDIKKFKVNKKLIFKILKNPEYNTTTKYQNFAAISGIKKAYILRIIYDIIDGDYKVITFHIARKGRYET